MITVRSIDATTYEVTVNSGSTTTHTVTLSDDYCQQLTAGRVPPEKLIEASFAFLLEREPNTSILRKFDLPLIGSYFPEYEREIARRV
jgi:hypothetical protein